MEKKSFKDFVDDLQYFYTENHQKMTIAEIAEKCREYIRENGFNCIEDVFNEDEGVAEWIEENHSDWNTDNFEWCSVLYNNLEFLCLDSLYGEPTFAEISISFYGDYDKGIGVFSVTTN